MIKIPYGQSYFPNLPLEGMYFVDKTVFLEKMEALNSRFLFFFRPRRFGKSLWVSVLQHYYGAEHKEKFQDLFGKYYIGQHPTPLANQYFVLKFDFSGIDTSTQERTYAGFLTNVKISVQLFFGAYHSYFPKEEQEKILQESSPEAMLKMLFALVDNTSEAKPICLLIDEYDHFANEILAFRQADFLNAVGRNGFVRKFYETIKIATQQGTVERLYVTGTSSLTLDSLTSGFNIGVNLTLNLDFHDMLGFDLAQTAAILTAVGVAPETMPQVLADLEVWYDGYAFHPSKAGLKLFNSDMVLYFADNFSQSGAYPERMLDVNIASDYGKIRQLFRIGGKEKERLEIMDKLLQEGFVAGTLTHQFNFERGITYNDFVSLLYYQGMVTVTGMIGDRWRFSPPNAVIEKLYYEYFAQILNERTAIEKTYLDIEGMVSPFLWENNPRPLLEMVEHVLKNLSNRDSANFSEKHLKAIFAAFLNLSQAFHVKGEPETKRQYLDLLLTRRLPFHPPHQFAIELKYLKKEDAAKLETVADDARRQLKGYLASDEIRSLADLKGWLFVFVGAEAKVAEEVG